MEIIVDKLEIVAVKRTGTNGAWLKVVVCKEMSERA